MTGIRWSSRQLTRCRRGRDRASQTLCLRSGLCSGQQKIQRRFLALPGLQRWLHARCQSLRPGTDASRPLRFRATSFEPTFPAASTSQVETGAVRTYRRPRTSARLVRFQPRPDMRNTTQESYFFRRRGIRATLVPKCAKRPSNRRPLPRAFWLNAPLSAGARPMIRDPTCPARTVCSGRCCDKAAVTRQL